MIRLCNFSNTFYVIIVVLLSLVDAMPFIGVVFFPNSRFYFYGRMAIVYQSYTSLAMKTNIIILLIYTGIIVCIFVREQKLDDAKIYIFFALLLTTFASLFFPAYMS
jgi:hypothetical protein